MPELTLFIHAHKAAGTSMIHLFGDDAAFQLTPRWRRTGAMPPYFEDLKKIGNYDQRDAVCNRAELTREFGRLRQDGINFAATEWLVPPVDAFPDDANYFLFTILRDPYARYVSNFRFDRSRGYRDVPDVYQFRDASIFRTYNYYTRFYSSRLNRDDSPVTAADFDAAVALLNRLDAVIILEDPSTLGQLAPLGVDVSKLQRRNTSEPSSDDVPAGFAQDFADRATWDYALYDEAKKIASRR